MIAAFAILAALIAREKTGRGQYVDVSMFDVMVSMLPVPAAHHFAGKTIPVGGKYVLSGAYPFYNVYETADARFMTLGALEPKFWSNFCAKVGRADLVPRQFDDGERRHQLFEEVRSVFKAKTQSDWIEIMRDADCCCEPVLSMSDAFAHEQTIARAMVQDARDDPAEKQLGFAYKMGATPPTLITSAPALGEHTDEVLTDLGISAGERARMREDGVIR